MMNTETTLDKNTEKRKAFKQLGYSALDTVEITQGLNVLLANYHVHYQKLRNYHWNVKGNDFFDLHNTFEELYTEAIANIDAIAERVRVFGQTPMSTLKEYLEASEITETGTDLSPEDMVKEVLHDIRILLSCMMDITEVAAESGDNGTDDMLTGYIRDLEKKHWMLHAWLQQK